jgi:hypothetical protein
MIYKIQSVAILVFLAMAGVGVTSGQTEVPTESKPRPVRRVVVTVTGARVRSEPNLNGTILSESAIGTLFSALSEKDGWDEVLIGPADEDGNANTGWISKTVTLPYDRGRPGVQAQQIADGYFSRKEVSFLNAKQLFEYLPSAADSAKTFEVGGDLRLKSLTALSLALKKIPINKSEESPYKEFLTKYNDQIAYSEPAGEWYVRSEEFWKLHTRYQKHKIAETIAWNAASNPLPGECEGYINCYLYLLRVTQGEYLNFYPNGKYAKQSLENIIGLLSPIVSDIQKKQSYYTTNDISDRAEFNKMLAELRKIVSRTPFVEKQVVLTQISQIAEGYR